MTDPSQTCPECGTPRPVAATSCPACLMRLGLGTQADEAPTIQRPGQPRQSATAPDHVGPYRLVRVLGEGGFGIVYLAEQEAPLRRTVALKVIKLGMDSNEVIARFEAEQHALALMSHPGIARVLDAGTTERGTPYFVMEHVPGLPITDYCDRNRLGTKQRLALFMQVCQAVHHAHQKGIVHRDLKPSNVLVAVEDGQARPKVIDFGISKALDQRAQERKLFTTRGVIVGTPAYMAPEQADPLGLDIDTTTDVYSLGVLLYELLSGVLPFDAARLHGVAFDELLRIIREEDPPSLSSRMRSGSGDSGAIAARRRTDASSLARQLTGDLDWITAKALEKDRTRRYPSASELAEDLRRYLSDEPVAAGPPNPLYVLRKTLRRHRLVVSAAAALMLFASALAVVALRSASRISEERDRAEIARSEASEQARLNARNAYVANLAAAQASLERDDVAEAKRRLAACDPSLRGWEWRHLSATTDSSLATLEAGEAVRGVSLSADGRTLRAFTSTSVHAWDATTLAKLSTTSVGSVDAASQTRTALLALSPDGASVVTRPETTWDWSGRQVAGALNVEKDGAILSKAGDALPPAPSGIQLRRLDGRGAIDLPLDAKTAGLVQGAATSPDGRWLATLRNEGVGWHRDIRELWDARTGRLERALEIRAPAAKRVTKNWLARQVMFSPDGRRLAVGGDMVAGLGVWSLSEPGEPLVIPCGDASSDNVSWSSDSEVVAFTCGDRVVAWDVETKKETASFSVDGHVKAAQVSPAANRIALAVGARIAVWDLGLRVEQGSHRGHEGGVTSLAWSGDGARLFSGGEDGTVRAWNCGISDMSATTILRLPAGSPLDWLFAAAVSPDGRRLALGGNTFLISGALQEATPDYSFTEALLAQEGGGTFVRFPALELAFAPKGGRLAAGVGNVVMIADPIAGLAPDPLVAGEAEVTGVAWNAEGSEVTTSARDGIVRTFEVSTGKVVRERRAGKAELTCVSVNASGLVVAGDADGVTWLWRDLEGAPAQLASGAGAVRCVAFSRSGMILVTGSADGDARTWDVSSAKPLARFTGHGEPVRAASFSPDGTRLVTGSGDTTLRIWDSATGDSLATLRGHGSTVFLAAFSPDGSAIASASSDATFRIWRASP